MTALKPVIGRTYKGKTVVSHVHGNWYRVKCESCGAVTQILSNSILGNSRTKGRCSKCQVIPPIPWSEESTKKKERRSHDRAQ